MATKPIKVGAYFYVDFDTEASGEAEAIMKVTPQIRELEAQLTRLNYDFKLERVAARRPGSSKKAKEREGRKRMNGGQDE